MGKKKVKQRISAKIHVHPFFKVYPLTDDKFLLYSKEIGKKSVDIRAEKFVFMIRIKNVRWEWEKSKRAREIEVSWWQKFIMYLWSIHFNKPSTNECRARDIHAVKSKSFLVS